MNCLNYALFATIWRDDAFLCFIFSLVKNKKEVIFILHWVCYCIVFVKEIIIMDTHTRCATGCEEPWSDNHWCLFSPWFCHTSHLRCTRQKQNPCCKSVLVMLFSIRWTCSIPFPCNKKNLVHSYQLIWIRIRSSTLSRVIINHPFVLLIVFHILEYSLYS